MFSSNRRGGDGNNNNSKSKHDEETEQHRKRLAQLLRYMGQMHQTLDSNSHHPNDDPTVTILETTDIRHLLQLQPALPPPFSFYASGTPACCWLRLTRMGVPTPPAIPPAVQAYLDEHRTTTTVFCQNPPPPSAKCTNRQRRQIQNYITNYRRYLVQQAHQQRLEPAYNRLFEWIQQDEQQSHELVWGLGQTNQSPTRQLLLQVLVEVELATDGALLIRPKAHTGVTLHHPAASAALHQTVAAVEPHRLSPGQPSTYVPLLQRLAVELSSGGRFVRSTAEVPAANGLVVTEAWTLFRRPKPSLACARDAHALADRTPSATSLPLATWALTHGPGRVPGEPAHRPWWSSARPAPATKPLFPLPTSGAQNRIAHLLLDQEKPAVVCEGPPGTGKTHTIANLIAAYLCRGKSVLVTCKNASALSVLRERLPPSVRDLAVDVSASESSGMRQLQRTVERLAQRICSVSSVLEHEKCRYLQANIADLEQELARIDGQLSERIETARSLLHRVEGARLHELSLSLAHAAPWILPALSEWSIREVTQLRNRVAQLVTSPDDPIHQVTGFDIPVVEDVLSHVSRMAGSSWSAVQSAAQVAVASIPLVGRSMKERLAETERRVAVIRVRNTAPPVSPFDWTVTAKALQHAKNVHLFESQVWERQPTWPKRKFQGPSPHMQELLSILQQAVEFKRLYKSLGMHKLEEAASQARLQDTRRGAIVARLQQLAEELVDCTVIMKLNESFSVEAQSALIKFAQIAGKNKFNKSSNPAKMTARQRRRRQEYLAAFDACCRFIPCWILTTSQISDYLPPQAGLFDLVICDEASQVEVVSMLPGMLRGKQWLIVGDAKQVSPTECFVSEDHMETLRSSLPATPFAESFLPGQSFFELCAAAFPTGRVVLSEHFRCAQEIISFSNEQFYDGRLVPLRLPMASERIEPSLLDVKVGGSKVGKVNEVEADEIVERIHQLVTESVATPRSIGVISLIGDEQSRLIRGRLLDRIGPQAVAVHNILVGDPPTFQGAERDIIFLSMVASPGSVPTQSQLMHFQRANVAMSRARDQLVLVRSLELTDVPSSEDVKLPIMTFFRTRAAGNDDNELPTMARKPVNNLLHHLLVQRGFRIRPMGQVWPNAMSVEDGDSRVALQVEGAGETLVEWQASFSQQKAIERVGWTCFRVDAWSLLTNLPATMDTILQFLASHDIHEPVQQDEAPHAPVAIHPEDNEVVVVSSDEEDVSPVQAPQKPDVAPSGPVDHGLEQMDASVFGKVVDMAFLRQPAAEKPAAEKQPSKRKRADETEDNLAPEVKATSLSRKRNASSIEDSDSESTHGPASEDNDSDTSKARRRKYRRLEKYQRDPRYYPGRDEKIAKKEEAEGKNNDWNDTASDLEGEGD